MKQRCRIKTLLMLTVVCAVGAVHMSAQSEANSTQYFATPAYYNPAAIGMDDNMQIRASSRLQWVGVHHAPRSFAASANMPFKIGTKRIGVGLVARQESYGLFRELNIGLQAAYKQKIWKGVLSGGVQVGFANEQFRGSRVFIPDNDDYHDSSDEAIPTTDLSGNAVDFAAGLRYDRPRWYVGVSCTHLTSPTIGFSDESGRNPAGSTTGVDGEGAGEQRFEFQLRRTLYFTAGGNIPIKNTLFEVMPSMMVKSDFAFYGAEVTGRVRYRKFLTFGLGYRYNDAASVLLAAEFKGFYVGYSYDYPITAMSRATHGSHELVAGYSLKLKLGDANRNRHKSIRIM